MKRQSDLLLRLYERADKEPSVTVLGKCDRDDFDAHEDVYLNILAWSVGVLKEP
jgi:hypothetical protein